MSLKRNLNTTKGYKRDHIYNADETEINFKMLPKMPLALKQEKSTPGFKINKQITLL